MHKNNISVYNEPTNTVTHKELIFHRQALSLVAGVHALPLVKLENFVIIDVKFFSTREEQIACFPFGTRKFST